MANVRRGTKSSHRAAAEELAAGVATSPVNSWVALLFLVSIVCAGCGPSAQQNLERADRLFQAGKFDDAALIYRKAIQKDPTSGEAYYRLGLTELMRRKTKDAYAALTRASVLLPGKSDIKVALADLFIKDYQTDPRRPAFDYKEAARLVGELEAQNPGSYDTLRLKGYLALIDRKLPLGIEHLQRANEINPLQADLVFALTQALIQEGRLAEAEEVALTLLEKQKDYIPLYDVLYRGYLAANRLIDAEGLLRSKINNNPGRPEFVLQLALHHARSGRLAERDAALRTLLDNPADFPQGYLSVGSYYAATGNWEEASRYFSEGRKKFPKDEVLYLKRETAVMLAQNKPQEARQSIETILKRAPKDREAGRLHAALTLADKNPENVDKAIAELDALVKETPEDSAARFTLARAQLGRRNLGEAREQLLECVRRNPLMLQAQILLAEIAVQNREAAEVLGRVQIILAIQPRNQRARLLGAMAATALNRFAEARKNLTSLMQDHPQYVDAELQLGLLDVIEKKHSEAEAIFRKHYRQGSADRRPLQGLVDVMLARRQAPQAIQFLKDELAKAEEPDPVRLLLAEAALQSGNYELALENFEHLLKRNPSSANLNIRVGDIHSRKGEPAKSLPYFVKALELAPNDPNAQFLLASAQDRSGNKTEAIAGYRRLIQQQPDNFIAVNNLAFLLADTEESLDEALTLAQRAQQKLGSQEQVNDTLGWIYLKKKLPDSALQIFTRLVKINPANATFRHHLGLALLAKGDKMKARTELNAALSKKLSPQEEAAVRETLSKLN